MSAQRSVKRHRQGQHARLCSPVGSSGRRRRAVSATPPEDQRCTRHTEPRLARRCRETQATVDRTNINFSSMKTAPRPRFHLRTYHRAYAAGGDCNTSARPCSTHSRARHISARTNRTTLGSARRGASDSQDRHAERRSARLVSVSRPFATRPVVGSLPPHAHTTNIGVRSL